MRKTNGVNRNKEKQKNSLLLNISVSLFTFVFLLLIFELVLRVVHPIPLYGVQEGLLQPNQETEYVFTNNWSGTHVSKDFSYTISTNSLGLNDEEFTEKNFSKQTLLFIGDSVTEGYGVSKEYAYPQMVKKIDPDVEIINAGVRGYGTRQSAKMYSYIENMADVDVVIYTFVYNDLFDNINQPYVYRGFISKNTTKNKLFTDVFLILRKFHTFRFLYYDLYYNSQSFDYQASSVRRLETSNNTMVLDEFRKEILVLKEATTTHNDTLIVVLQPWMKSYQIYKNDDFLTGDVAIHQVIKSILEEENISYIDISQEIRITLESKDLYFPYQDGHYSVEGNEFLAQEVVNKLENVSNE